MKKALQITHLRAPEVYQNGRSCAAPERGSRRPARRVRGALRPRSRPPIRARLRDLLRASARGDAPAAVAGAGSSAGSGSGPGHEPQRRAASQALSDLGCALVELERPDRVARVHEERAVALRSAPATRCGRSPRPTAAGQRLDQLADLGLRRRSGRARGGPRRRAAPSLSLHRWPGDLEQLVGRRRQRSRVGRGDRRVWPPAARSRERCAGGRVELREHVVEQEQRRDAAPLGEQLGLREQEREHREPLLPLRAEARAGRGRRPRRRRRRDAARAR